MTTERAKIVAKPEIKPVPLPPESDSSGVRNPKLKSDKRRAKMSQFLFGDTIAKPSADEVAHAEEHVAHDAALEAPIFAEEDTLEVAHDGSVLHRVGGPATNRAPETPADGDQPG